ncbi:DUF3299 domain-containing protein [Sorangium sp. So ce834]|uniref:DUF3299 domain-containing protein n=1 Tax=Sorangium sp. So ce834 TaxID=3133321 RepID=UPI003F63C392
MKARTSSPWLVALVVAGITLGALFGLRRLLTPRATTVAGAPRAEAAAPSPRATVTPSARAAATSEDPLAHQFEAALRDAAAEGLEERRFRRMVSRLAEAIAQEGLGDERAREQAAVRLVQRMIEALEERPPRGAGSPVTPEEAARLRARAEGFATYVRMLMPPGGAHTPALRAPPPERLPPGYAAVRWEALGGFPYVEGAPLPASARRLDGQRVGVSGYMDTLGEVRGIREFVLVESQITCCFTSPPELNQLVLVRVEAPAGASYVDGPVLVLGTLEVGEQREAGGVTSVYRLRASSVRPLHDGAAEP